MMINIGQRWNDTDKENGSTWTKTSSIDTFSNTNITWTDLGLNPGLCGKRPVN
jgi:hypothetical protein